MRHRCYHGAAHQSTASHSWFTQLHMEVNYLTSKLRHLKSKPCGNYKYAEGRNCKTEQQNWTVAYLLALTVWTSCHISASNENLLKFQVNSLVHSWVSHTFFTFPHRGKTSSNKENAWINAIFHEPQSTSDRFEGNLYDVKVNVLRWRPLSFKHIHLHTHTNTQCTVHAYSSWRQFVSITQVSAHSSKSFHGFLFAGALRVNEESACFGRV